MGRKNLVILTESGEREELVILAAGVDPRRVTLFRNRHVAGVKGPPHGNAADVVRASPQLPDRSESRTRLRKGCTVSRRYRRDATCSASCNVTVSIRTTRRGSTPAARMTGFFAFPRCGEDDENPSCNVTVSIRATRRGSTPAARMTRFFAFHACGEDDGVLRVPQLRRGQRILPVPRLRRGQRGSYGSTLAVRTTGITTRPEARPDCSTLPVRVQYPIHHHLSIRQMSSCR